jgi:GGDEF domain-containing protein
MKRLFPLVPLKRRGLPLFDSSGWYADWYFEYRLEEEVARAKRYGITFTVLYIVLQPEPGISREKRHRVMTQLFNDGFRRSDLPAKLANDEFAVILPQTDDEQAGAVEARLKQILAEFRPAIGLANYPKDSRDDYDLLAGASHRALAEMSNPSRAIARRWQKRRQARRSA